AFLDRCASGELRFDRIELDAFAIDETLHPHLSETLRGDGGRGVEANIRQADFIQYSVESLADDMFSRPPIRYTHAILNPPYKKLHSQSTHRLALRHAGIETVNLYSAFVALAISQMAPGGQLVAIIPRSFCNGPYYRSFREFILERTAIRHIHLFGSRTSAFKDDDVLQENIIILLERAGRQREVTVANSTDDSLADLTSHEYPLERIVMPGDREQCIRVPASPEPGAIERFPTIFHTLAELGIGVSTGPVVDFRVKLHLRDMPGPGTVPLLYPCHFPDRGATWPIEGIKKSNAIDRNADTEKWLYPTGFYCVVRRFSSKEERRRIVASVVDPARFHGAPMLGFENHLNVFHENRGGLPESLARGLAVFLNTTA